MFWRLALTLVISMQVSCVSSPLRPHRVVVDFRVVDEEGNPVQAAHVLAGFFDSDQGGKGLSDTNGLFRIMGKAVSSLHCRVLKKGYYASHGEVWDGPSEQQMAPPTNQYTVVLRKVIAPTAMIQRKVDLTLPSLDIPCAVDLAAGDWVAPHGTGKVADVFFSGWKNVEGRLDYDLRCTMRFGEQDGIRQHFAPGARDLSLKSELAPPQRAPDDGYTNCLTFSASYHPGKGFVTSFSEREHLLFRARTVVDEQGRVKQAHVGWIESGFAFEGRFTNTMRVLMRYYFNPDPHSRSLEPANLPRLPAPE